MLKYMILKPIYLWCIFMSTHFFLRSISGEVILQGVPTVLMASLSATLFFASVVGYRTLSKQIDMAYLEFRVSAEEKEDKKQR